MYVYLLTSESGATWHIAAPDVYTAIQSLHNTRIITAQTICTLNKIVGYTPEDD